MLNQIFLKVHSLLVSKIYFIRHLEHWQLKKLDMTKLDMTKLDTDKLGYWQNWLLTKLANGKIGHRTCKIDHCIGELGLAKLVTNKIDYWQSWPTAKLATTPAKLTIVLVIWPLAKLATGILVNSLKENSLNMSVASFNGDYFCQGLLLLSSCNNIHVKNAFSKRRLNQIVDWIIHIQL